MESSYQKAYKIFKFIDENVINDLNLRYKESCAQIKIFVTENYDLNMSRSKTKAAIELLDNNYLSSESQGKNVRNKLLTLKEYGLELDKSSRELRTQLDLFNDFYIENSKKFSNELLHLFEQLSEGIATGDDLINGGKNLAKEIEKFINNDLEYEINKFKMFIQKKVDYFTENIDSLYKEIERIDSDRLPKLKHCIWTDLEFDNLFLKPAYSNNDE